LKIYAKPEAEIYSEHDTLDHVATFLIYAQQVITGAMGEGHILGRFFM
jgi:hypothetical protein